MKLTSRHLSARSTRARQGKVQRSRGENRRENIDFRRDKEVLRALAGQIASSNWTTSPVQLDRTDTPNLERQRCPEFVEWHAA